MAFNEDDISKNIFRLGNLELQIWVSNDLKEELTRSNISGIDFIPLDEFTEEE